MANVKVVSDVILLSEIVDDEPLVQRLRSLDVDETIEVEVAGVPGRWQRTADSIQPIGDAKSAWLALRQGTVRVAQIGLGSPTYLATFGDRNRFWDVPESQIR